MTSLMFHKLNLNNELYLLVKIRSKYEINCEFTKKITVFVVMFIFFIFNIIGNTTNTITLIINIITNEILFELIDLILVLVVKNNELKSLTSIHKLKIPIKKYLMISSVNNTSIFLK